MGWSVVMAGWHGDPIWFRENDKREPVHEIIVDMLRGREAPVGKMKLQLHFVAALALLCAGTILTAGHGTAQGIDFGAIDKFQSLGNGTLHVGDPPKSIVDDDERHAIILTIWDADAQTKIYWRAPDTKESRTTIMPDRGIQTFQTLGVFRLEAIGAPDHEVKYGYVLLGLRK
jgi:hypothetical protein